MEFLNSQLASRSNREKTKYFSVSALLWIFGILLMEISLTPCLSLVNRHLGPPSSLRESPPYRTRQPNEANIFKPSADSVLEDYSDQVYYELAAEYQDNLRMSAQDKVQIDKLNFPAAPSYDSGDTADTSKTEVKHEETYEEQAARLKCDNPWFWNAPKCTWLDVQAKNVIKRTQRNAKTSVWFIGSVSAILITWTCGTYCLYLLKMRNRRRLQKLREKYAPGRLELPNGKVVEYPATQEEMDAYEQFMKAIIIQEMGMAI